MLAHAIVLPVLDRSIVRATYIAWGKQMNIPSSHRLAAGCLAAFALLISACTFSLAPVGERPLQLVPAEWNGLWSSDQEKQSYRVEVADPAAGRIRMTILPDPKSGRDSELVDVLLTSGGGGVFANLVHPEGHVWFRLERRGDTVLVRAPFGPLIAAKIAAGELPGHVADERVILDPLSPAHLQYLASEEGLSLYVGEALALRRRS